MHILFNGDSNLSGEELEDPASNMSNEIARHFNATSTNLSLSGAGNDYIYDTTIDYLKNNPNYTKGHMPVNVASFGQIRPLLNNHVSKVYGLEVPLYSDKLRVAGRVDCLAEWDGELSIIDFKTSKREKKREDIDGYFTQASAYSYMTYERTGMLPKKIVILMMVDDGEPLVFIERSKDWIEKFISIRKSVDI